MSLGCGDTRIQLPDLDAGYPQEDGPMSVPQDGPDFNDAIALPDGAGDACVAADAFIQQDAAPATPYPPGTSLVGDAPCAFPASLSFDAAKNALFMTCGGAANALYRWTLGGSGDWASVGTIAGYPSHHLRLDDQHYLVNHSAPDGFTIVDTQSGAASDTVSFSALALKDPQGQALPFVPNNPAGAALAGATLCVATSNLDHIDMDPQLTTFHPGTLVCLPYLGNGTVDRSAAVAWPTSSVNPTGIALIDAQPRGDGTQRLAVLSAGPYAPSLASPAALDICAAPAMSCTPIDLGAITAQLSPSLALTSGGLVLVGVQQPANALLGVDPAAETIEFNRAMPLVANFIASAAVLGDVVALSDFGIFGQGGSVLFANIAPAGWSGVPVTPLMGSAGPSAIAGTKLYQSVTANDGASGSVWSINLEYMQ